MSNSAGDFGVSSIVYTLILIDTALGTVISYNAYTSVAYTGFNGEIPISIYYYEYSIYSYIYALVSQGGLAYIAIVDFDNS